MNILTLIRQKRRRIALVIAALALILLSLSLIGAGTSIFVLPTAETREELEAAGENGGGLCRPFVTATFEYTTFSGLYLSGDDGVPAFWVMWGFRDECATCFFMAADGTDRNGDGEFTPLDAPSDLRVAEYVLRAPRASLDEHSEWVLGESIGDTASYYDLTEEEASQLFTGTVLAATRSELVASRIAFWVGLAMAALAAALFFAPEDLLDKLAAKRAAGKAAEAPTDESAEKTAEPTDEEADEPDDDETDEATEPTGETEASDSDDETAEADADEEATEAAEPDAPELLTEVETPTPEEIEAALAEDEEPEEESNEADAASEADENV